MPRLLTKLENRSYTGALVGDKGNGKTTLMLELEEPLNERGFDVIKIFLNQEKRKLSRSEFRALRKELSANHIILLDGAEQMSWLQWMVFKWTVRKAKGLIITVHSHSKLPTLLECRTRADQFISMVRELTSSLLHFNHSDEQLTNLWESHAGNTRLAFRELYDQMAE